MEQHLKLDRLTLKYFKGVRDLTINFSGDTKIYGSNAAGKTTIFDGLSWLLFGKNSLGQTENSFTLKTLDRNNNVIPRVDHIVEADFTLGDKKINLKKVYKEKWVKKRGQLEPEFSGHTTDYYWNDVPMKGNEYQAKINGIISEDVFKLITDPLAFNQMHWQDKRNILTSMVEDVKDTEIALGNDDFKKLLTKISDISLKEYRDALASKRKKLKEAIRDIPSRIDEVKQGAPDSGKDFGEIKKSLESKEKELASIESQIDDVNKRIEDVAAAKQKLQDQRFELLSKSGEIKLSIKSELSKKHSNPKQELNNLQNQLTSVDSNIRSTKTLLEREENLVKQYENQLESEEREIQGLRDERDKVDAETLKFNETFECPSCKRPLDAEDVEVEKQKMLDDFNSDKASRLDKIVTKGMNLKSQIEQTKKEIKESKETIEGYKADLIKLNGQRDNLINEINKLDIPTKMPDIDAMVEVELSKNEEYIKLGKQLQELEAKITDFKAPSNDELIESKRQIYQVIDDLKEELREEQAIQDAEKRVAELEAKESEYSQQIADIEKEEFVAENFTIAKAELLESRVNKMFDGVRWKLFDTQVNGAQVPTCELISGGVPWSDLNFAAKINTGIKCINVLIDHYCISAPLFVDAAESIVSIEPTKAQTILLIVSAEDKTLRVV
jgi:DNA repair exonuclease SbcCD ATPase subunit